MLQPTPKAWRAACLEAAAEGRPFTELRTRALHVPWTVLPFQGPARPRLIAEARALARERIRHLAAQGRPGAPRSRPRA